MTVMTSDRTSAASGRWSHRLARWTLMAAGAALIGLVLVQSWQVYARYVRNDSPAWSEPLSLLLLCTTMSLAAAAGVHSQSHFSFQLLAEALPARIQHALRGLRHLLVAALGACLAIWSWQLLVDGWAIDQAGIALPQSATYAPLALGGLLMLVFALDHIWARWRTDAGSA